MSFSRSAPATRHLQRHQVYFMRVRPIYGGLLGIYTHDARMSRTNQESLDSFLNGDRARSVRIWC